MIRHTHYCAPVQNDGHGLNSIGISVQMVTGLDATPRIQQRACRPTGLFDEASSTLDSTAILPVKTGIYKVRAL